MFIEELIEKLKSGPVWCWTRGGWCVEVITHIPNNIEPFQAYQMRWYATGKYYAGVSEDGRDLIAICRNPKLIQEQFERDTQRQPVAGDWVVILDAEYSKHLIGKVVQIDTTNGTHINIEGTQNFHISSLADQTHLRFATPEEIAEAQQAKPAPPENLGDMTGYRLLAKDEPLQPGDEFLSKHGNWTRSISANIGDERKPDTHYRRKIQPTQPSEQACTSLFVVCRGVETTKGIT